MAEVAQRRPGVHHRRRAELPAQLPRASRRSMAVEVGRRARRGRQRDGPELRPVHLLRLAAAAPLRGHLDRQRFPVDADDAAGDDLRRPGRAAAALLENGRLAYHRRARSFTALQRGAHVSLDGQPLPIEVDGDYIGTAEEFAYEAAPGRCWPWPSSVRVAARPPARGCDRLP